MIALDDLGNLLAQSNVVVFTTYRRDGMPQQSLVTVGELEGTLAFTTRSRNAKAFNLARDPRCAEVSSLGDTSAEQLRIRLREIYRAAAGSDHPNWDEYDKVMREQGRVAVQLRPTRIVGHNVE